MTTTTQLLLIRHGETAWNAVRRLQGHLDIGLNEAGEQQAAALGLALRGEALDAIIASDLQRAMHTAQAIASHQGLSVQLDAGLRERCYGAFEGLLYSDIGAHYPEAYAAWQAREVDAVFPPGERIAESMRQFYERSLEAILRHATLHAGKKIALVAHGGVLECAYRAATGMPLDTPRNFEIMNASVNRFALTDSKLHLVQWGDVTHLDTRVLDELDQRVP